MEREDGEQPIALVTDEVLDVVGDVDDLRSAGVDSELRGSHCADGSIRAQ